MLIVLNIIWFKIINWFRIIGTFKMNNTTIFFATSLSLLIKAYSY